jgi:hypothetical protein
MIRCATLSHRVDRHANARNRRGRQALAPSAADFPTAEIRAHQSAPARTASRHQAAHLRFDGRWGRAGPWCIRGEALARRASPEAAVGLPQAGGRAPRSVSRPRSGRGAGSPIGFVPHGHVLHPHAHRLARRAPRRTRYRDQHTRGRARCAADTDPRHAANGDRPQRRRAQAATSSHPADQDPSSGAHSTCRRPGGRAAAAASNGASSEAPNPRRRAAAKATPTKRSGASLTAEQLERSLADVTSGLSGGAIAERAGVGYSRVLALLRELEASGKVRRTGTRRSTLWLPITDEDRIAQRAAELQRLVGARRDDRSQRRGRARAS